VNRSDFQELAQLHVQHARALLDAQLYSGAYYMCGYVVECALKACICRKTSQFDFRPSPDEAKRCVDAQFRQTHGVSDLKEQIKKARQADRALDVKWREVDNWSESSRYERRSQEEAEDLFAAVSDPAFPTLAELFVPLRCPPLPESFYTFYDWKLVVVSPEVEEKGTNRLYTMTALMLKELSADPDKPLQFPLDRIQLVGPNTLLYRSVRDHSGIRYGPVREGYAMDSYIYKMD
jgi:hypothetical protein